MSTFLPSFSEILSLVASLIPWWLWLSIAAISLLPLADTLRRH